MSGFKWPKTISLNGRLYEFAAANLTQAAYSPVFKDAGTGIVLDHEQAYLSGTVYFQGEEAADFIKDGYCERCLRPAREWGKMDALGIAVAGDYDRGGNLVGFLCPECGFVKQ